VGEFHSRHSRDKEAQIDPDRDNRWWRRWFRNRNLLWAIIVILAVWILILVSIIVDDFGGIQEIGLWEWVGVLIVPVVLAASAALLTGAQDQRERGAVRLQAQDEALQQYLDQVSKLLIQHEMQRRNPMGSDLFSKLVQARTLTLLLKLDSDRKRSPLKLIAQLGLINRHQPLLNLKNAGFNDADLHEVTLLNVSLKEADLRGAKLTGANLRESDLTWADLRGADPRRAILTRACLKHANLLPYDRNNPAQLNAPHLLNGSNPSHADERRKLPVTRLDEAHLQEADLSGTFLYRTNLSGANLRGARYDAETIWPEGFVPQRAAAVAD
jgi:uncharacterized protein YjbI with pentapeptide repeats